MLELKALPWKLIGLCALGMFIAGLMLALKIERTQNVKLKAQIEKCSEARRADRATYERAQAEAALANKQQIDRIRNDQERVSAETKSKYERDLARLRAGGLRKDLAAPQGSPDRPGTGAAPDATGRADGQNVCVPRSLLVRAAEIELARNSLIDWLEKQLAIPRN